MRSSFAGVGLVVQHILQPQHASPLCGGVVQLSCGAVWDVHRKALVRGHARRCLNWWFQLSNDAGYLPRDVVVLKTGRVLLRNRPVVSVLQQKGSDFLASWLEFNKLLRFSSA